MPPNVQVNLTGQQISDRNLVPELLGNMKLPLGTPNNEAADLDQIREFTLRGLQFPDGNIYGTFTVTLDDDIENGNWPGHVFAVVPLGVPQVQSTAFTVDLNMTTDRMDVMVDNNTRYTSDTPASMVVPNNTYIVPKSEFVLVPAVDYDIPNDSAPDLAFEFVRGYVVTVNGGNVGVYTDRLPISTDSAADYREATTLEIYPDGFNDLIGQTGAFIAVETVPMTGLNVPVNQLAAVFRVNLVSNIEEGSVSFIGVHNYAATVKSRTAGPNLASLTAATTRVIGYYPITGASVDPLGNDLDPIVYYAGLLPSNTETTLAFKINGADRSVVVTEQNSHWCAIGGTVSGPGAFIVALNAVMGAHGLQFSVVRHNSVYVLGVTNTTALQITLNFPAQPGTTQGSGRSNDWAAVLNLYGRTFTVDPVGG